MHRLLDAHPRTQPTHCAGTSEWGDNDTLVAAALHFRGRIHVCMADLNGGRTQSCTSGAYLSVSWRTLVVAYLSRGVP